MIGTCPRLFRACGTKNIGYRVARIRRIAIAGFKMDAEPDEHGSRGNGTLKVGQFDYCAV